MKKIIFLFILVFILELSLVSTNINIISPQTKDVYDSAYYESTKDLLVNNTFIEDEGNYEVASKSNNIAKNIVKDKKINNSKHTDITQLYDDIIFNSNFDQGNLINVEFQYGNNSGYRYYTAEVNYSTETFARKHWWFYYSIENCSGKTIKISITNLLDIDIEQDRWPNLEPVYSYDNNEIWHRIPSENYSCCGGNTFNITISPTFDYNSDSNADQIDRVWIAPIPPYPVWKRDKLISRYKYNPYFRVDVIGQTPKGMVFKVIEITESNPDYVNNKKTKIYITAQIHGGETIASWVTQGLINFLMNSTDRRARVLRRNYVWRINPVVNVEGVYYGISRYTPFRYGLQRDLNRNWNATPIPYDLDREMNLTYEDIKNFMPDAVLDLRATINNESEVASATDCFFISSYNITDEVNLFLNNLSGGINNNSDLWPETGKRLRNSLTRTTMVNQIRQRLGINLSTMVEHPFDDRRNTTQHPIDHNPQNTTDWQEWGKRLALGLYNYFGPTPTNLIVDPPNITIGESTNVTCSGGGFGIQDVFALSDDGTIICSNNSCSGSTCFCSEIYTPESVGTYVITCTAAISSTVDYFGNYESISKKLRVNPSTTLERL